MSCSIHCHAVLTAVFLLWQVFLGPPLGHQFVGVGHDFEVQIGAALSISHKIIRYDAFVQVPFHERHKVYFWEKNVEFVGA